MKKLGRKQHIQKLIDEIKEKTNKNERDIIIGMLEGILFQINKKADE